jgi:hypothetical protein
LAKQHSIRRRLFHQQIRIIYKKETSEILHLEHNFVGAETWTLRKIEKYLESFENDEMWCWKRMEKVSLSGSVKNKTLHGVKEKRNILYTIKRRTANWIGHILPRN